VVVTSPALASTDESIAGCSNTLLPEEEQPSPIENVSKDEPFDDKHEEHDTSCDNIVNEPSHSKSVILSENNSENLITSGQTSDNIDHEIQGSIAPRLEAINVQYGVEENGLYEESGDKENSSKNHTNSRKRSVEVGEVAGTTDHGDNLNTNQNQVNQIRSDENDLMDKVDEAQLQDDVDEDSKRVEMGVDADMFWDSVSSRAQVLAVPNSFKTGSKKIFRQF
jgi:hypothetical protein